MSLLDKATLEMIRQILDGKLIPKEATHAASADSATEAAHATSADSATEAAHATSADSATEAVHATSADSATSATSATTATSATKLATARTIRTNLASTSTASFDGSANVTPGVTGTLPISNGGTGLTSSPSMLTNLASTSAANVLQSSPRPGVTGILPISNGGTGSSSFLSLAYSFLANSWSTIYSSNSSGTQYARNAYVKFKVSSNIYLQIAYGTMTSNSVTFANAFTTAPFVMTSLWGNSDMQSQRVAVASVSTTGFTTVSGSSTSYPGYYIAIGYTSS